MDEYDFWIILRVESKNLDIASFLGDYHQEYDSAYDELVAMGFSEEQIDENQVPWWNVLTCTNQVRYTRDIPAKDITPVSVLKKGKWLDYAKIKK